MRKLTNQETHRLNGNLSQFNQRFHNKGIHLLQRPLLNEKKTHKRLQTDYQRDMNLTCDVRRVFEGAQ